MGLWPVWQDRLWSCLTCTAPGPFCLQTFYIPQSLSSLKLLSEATWPLGCVGSPHSALLSQTWLVSPALPRTLPLTYHGVNPQSWIVTYLHTTRHGSHTPPFRKALNTLLGEQALNSGGIVSPSVLLLYTLVLSDCGATGPLGLYDNHLKRHMSNNMFSLFPGVLWM